jgi:amylosucrase
VTALTLSGLPSTGADLIGGGTIDLRRDLVIPAHGIVWMRVAE